MSNHRAIIKEIFYKTRIVQVLDFFLYQIAWLRNRKKNYRFRKTHPDLIIPPDYFLYETYKLDYKRFFKGGEYSAKKIIEWTKKYFEQEPKRILDWGCGVSRVVIHIDKNTNQPLLHACDINEQMIMFNKKHYTNISYSLINYNPPTNYEDEYFDLVYGFSIFTHIEGHIQEEWIKEIHRILNRRGIFIFTTHGRFFYSKLLRAEKDTFNKKGVFTKAYRQKGHRMMSTYNQPNNFKKIVEKYFEILEFHDGELEYEKIGGQDLWIVKKQ